MRARSAGLLPLLVLLAGAALARPGMAVTRPAATARPAAVPRAHVPPELAQIQHLVVLYLENRSFDNLYGEFPGADGLANVHGTAIQVDSAGAPYKVLPRYPNQAYPRDLPNAPFAIEQYVGVSVKTPNLTHRFYQEQAQIDGGKMDRFALLNNNSKGLVMGYYHTSSLPLPRLARQYTLCDRFFHAAFGGSFLNHQWLVAAATPRLDDATLADSNVARFVARLDDAGNMKKDGAISPDGFVINTSYSANPPHPIKTADPGAFVPPFTQPTIGDRLTEKGVSWAWYSGGWDSAEAGRPDTLFQFHHQPFVYYARYAPGTPARAAHLKDERAFVAAADAGKLPAVAFAKPGGALNEHPNYADLLLGDQHAFELVQHVLKSPQWAHTAIIVTYDENGGFWDHVAPPRVDRWGPGTRVPTLVIAPFARKRWIDHHVYDTTSILALIEHRWDLAALSDRDAHALDLRAAFVAPRPRRSR